MTDCKSDSMLSALPLLAMALVAVPLIANAREYRLEPGRDVFDGVQDRLLPGDTLLLAPGQVYHETLLLCKGGTAAKPITIRGNGAVISGLTPIADDSWQDRGDGLYFFPNDRSKGANDPQAYDALRRRLTPDVQKQRRLPVAELAKGQALWKADGLWFRTADGRPPTGICGTMLGEGVKLLSGAGYVIVENLVCEYVANDGFNAHGSCPGLVFRDITGRFCGDEGISVHEDVTMAVYNGRFHHCGNGFTDICASQTAYYGCTSESNRYFGAQFNGGHHVLVDCVFRDNPSFHLQFNSGKISGSYGYPEDGAACPALSGGGFLKRVTFAGTSGVDLKVTGVARVHAADCSFSNGEKGVVRASKAVFTASACKDDRRGDVR